MTSTFEDRWKQPSFVSLCALLSGLALPVSGVVDHFAAQSSAGGWSIVHVALGTVFVVFCTWHIVLNRRALLRYLRDKAAAWRSLPTREAVAAIALVGGVLALTVTHAVVGP